MSVKRRLVYIAVRGQDGRGIAAGPAWIPIARESRFQRSAAGRKFWVTAF